MTSAKSPRVLLVDFCSEKNRGDAAMQVGLINLVQRHFPSPDISVISVFGTNQFDDISGEYDHSLSLPITLLGGVKPTFYPLGETGQRSEILFEILNAISFIPSLLLLLLKFAGVPVALLARMLPAKTRKTFFAIRDADIVIWNGRNFRSRKNWILETYRILHVIYHPLLCASFSKPMACVGASVWDLNSPISRWLLRSAFEKCFFVSLREQNSFKSAGKLLGARAAQRIRLLPDLSFAVFQEVEEIVRKREPLAGAELPQRVGITLVDWKADGASTRDEYKLAMVDTIRYLIKNNSSIVLIPQVTKKWESFGGLLEEMNSILSPEERARITVMEGEPTVGELLEAYSRLDFLIATRMHSAIFASAVQTPLIAIAYDSGGKWSILEKLGYGEYLVRFADISAAKLIERMTACWQNRRQVLDVVRGNLVNNIARVDQNVLELLDMLPSVNMSRK